jgi:hypothetical protein
MTKAVTAGTDSTFGLGHSFVIRHSSFGFYRLARQIMPPSPDAFP